jgi:azurin
MKYIILTLTMLCISMININACPTCDAHAKSEQKHVTVSGNDQMQFDIRQFIVDKGADVKLTFKNVGKLPKIAMGHNLVILKEGVSALAFGSKCLSNGANASNPLPDSVKSDVLAYTKLLGPGDSDTITFKAPDKPGDYQYVCTFPGHFAMMRGVMTVR